MAPSSQLSAFDARPKSKRKTLPDYDEGDDMENVDPISKANKPTKSSKSRLVPRRKLKDTALCQTTSKSYLNRMPAEILGMICEELPEEDLPALRLQCQYLCEIATRHIFRSVLVRFKKTSIAALFELSNHPALSRNVETIVYEPNLVERLTRDSWEKRIPLRDYHHTAPIPPTPKQSASQRDWRLHHRTVRKAIRQGERKPYTQKELEIAWPIYKRYLQEQEDLIDRDWACKDLCQAIESFPNLTAVHVNFSHGLWYGSGWTADTSVNPYGDGLCQADGSSPYLWEFPGLGQIVSLMKMLGKVEVKLTSLRIGCLNWRFFEQCGETSEYLEEDNGGDLFKTMGGLVQSLHDIKLVITTWSDEYENEDRGESEVEECRTYLKNALLGRMLSKAPDLRKLAIASDASDPLCAIEFQYLAMNTHWPHLRTIKLDCIDAHERDWIGFYERHAKTLKHVALGTIRLLDGDWLDVLERMQQLLVLKEVHFDKDLYGLDLDQMWRFYPPGCTSSEDDSVQENRTRWALENFMIRGGVCPLRDEAAHPQIPLNGDR
ncbi:MAG: hypothetical protein Q9188_002127 [Gyalolechia gomerana]